MLPRSFFLSVAAGWCVLGAAGVSYARWKQIPLELAAPVIAAFLVEYVLYLVPGFERVRDRLRGLPIVALGVCLVLSAMAPYLIYSFPTGQFRPFAAGRLLLLVTVVAFWYMFRRPSVSADLGMLALLAAAVLSRFFRQVYTFPIPRLGIDILGHLMLIRLAATVMLVVREVDDPGFGFLPTLREWKIGLRYFLYFLPLGLAAALGAGLIHFTPDRSRLWRAPVEMASFLWVVALSEEFYFRGLLQHWVAEWTGRPRLALALASILFGLAHLGFRGFPNWKFAALAALQGWFYGKAYVEAGGIRAPMVAHALVVTTWRTFFS